MRHSTAQCLTLLLTLVSCLSAHAETDAPKYSVTEIIYPGNDCSTSTSAINNHGDIVGIFTNDIGEPSAFARINGAYHKIDAFKATDINDDGTVVGFHKPRTLRGRTFCQPFRWTLDDGIDSKFMNRSGTSLGRAMQINNKGQIVVQANKRGQIGLRCDPDGTVAAMGTNYNGFFVEFPALPMAISERGAVIGNMVGPDDIERPIIWHEGKYLQVPEVERQQGTFSGINANHDIVGDLVDEDGRTVAFLWQDSQLQTLGMLDGVKSSALAVSDSGVVVGWFVTKAERARGFIWINGTMHDVNDLVDLGSGWIVTEANGVNNQGQISALAERNGVHKGLLLSPVEN